MANVGAIINRLTYGMIDSTQSLLQTQEGYLLHVKAGSLTDAEAGYAPGALGINTSTGNVYRNTGTKTSSSWGLFATPTLDAVFDAGQVIDSANAAKKLDIGDGTDNLYIYVTSASNMAFITTNAGTDLTIAPAGGDVTLTGTLTVSSTVTSTGNFAVGANKLTVAALTGNTVIAGDLALTGDFSINAGAFAVTAATGDIASGGAITVTTSVTCASIACSGNITGTFTGTWGSTAWNASPTITVDATDTAGVTIAGGTVTTGDILYITSDASLVGGYFIRCRQTAAGTNRFAVDADGGTTIRGGGIGNAALTLTTGDILVSDGNVDITTATANGNDILDITRGNSATGGHGIDIAMGTAAQAGNAININFGNAASTGHGFAITYSGANTGDALNLNMTNNVAGGAIVITGAGVRTDNLIEITDVPNNGASTIYIGATTQHNSGHVIAVALGAGSTHSCNVFNFTTAAAYTGDVIAMNMANSGAGAQCITLTSAVNHTSPMIQVTAVPGDGGNVFQVASTSTHANGGIIQVIESGVVANNIFEVSFGGAFIGDVLNVVMNASGVGAQAIVISSNVNHTSPMIQITAVPGAAGNVLEIASTSTNATGGVIQITETGAVASNLIELAYGGLNTGDSINITMNGAAATAQALVISSNVANTNPMIQITSVAGDGGNVLQIASTSAHANGGIIQITETGAVASNLIELAYAGANTGDAVNITMTNAATSAQALVITGVAASVASLINITVTGADGGDAIYIGSTAAHAGSQALQIVESGTVANNVIGISYGGASTGDALNIAMAGAAAASQAIVVTSNVAHTGAVLSFGATGSFAGGTGLLCSMTYATGLLASATAGFILDLNDTTNEVATSYVLQIRSTNNQAVKITTGTSHFVETVTFKAINKEYLASNYVTAGGANNALTATLTDNEGSNVTLATGLKLRVNTSTFTLQVGANTLALNGGAAKSIKSHRNVANDIGVAYAAASIVELIYDGTQWLDLSQ